MAHYIVPQGKLYTIFQNIAQCDFFAIGISHSHFFGNTFYIIARTASLNLFFACNRSVSVHRRRDDLSSTNLSVPCVRVCVNGGQQSASSVFPSHDDGELPSNHQNTIINRNQTISRQKTKGIEKKRGKRKKISGLRWWHLRDALPV